MKGHFTPHTTEAKLKISLARKGKGIGNKNAKGKVPWNRGKQYQSKHRGRKLSEKHKQALRVPHKGAGVYKRTEYHSEIGRKGMQKFYDSGGIAGFRKKKYFSTGEKNSNWKGGITPINEKIRRSVEYKLWRKAVFQRDNFTCIWCGQKGGNLEADHIKRFADYPELRFAIDNGRTLCKKCHLTTDTYGRRIILE